MGARYEKLSHDDDAYLRPLQRSGSVAKIAVQFSNPVRLLLRTQTACGALSRLLGEANKLSSGVLMKISVRYWWVPPWLFLCILFSLFMGCSAPEDPLNQPATLTLARPCLPTNERVVGSNIVGQSDCNVEIAQQSRPQPSASQASAQKLSEDEEFLNSYNKSAQHVIDLWAALNTRLLTDAELEEAIKLGDNLNAAFLCEDFRRCFGPNYKPEERAQERRDAFLFQYRLRWEHERIFGK